MKTKLLLAFGNIVLLSLLLISWRSNADEENFAPPTACEFNNMISPKIAMSMSASYKSGLSSVLRPAPGRLSAEKEARAAWFSIQGMEDYICAIKKNLGSGCKDKFPNLGIRFYYGRYPTGAGMDALGIGNRPGYGLQHTLFMVPTYDAGKVHTDFDPTQLTGKDCVPKPLKILWQDPGYPNKKTGYIQLMYNMLESESAQSARNHGDLTPPDEIDGAFFLSSNND